MAWVTLRREVEVEVDILEHISKVSTEDLQGELTKRYANLDYPPVVKTLLAALDKGSLSMVQMRAIEETVEREIGK